DADQPGPETRAVAQAREAAVGLQHGFLGDVLGIGGVAQASAADPKGERPALGQAFFELPSQRGLFQFEHQLGIRRVTGPDQGYFLHPLSPYTSQTPPPGRRFTGSCDSWVSPLSRKTPPQRAQECASERNLFVW